MFPSRYLTERHLAGFDKYKYSAVDTSPLANYIMHPFWNRVVQFYPKWLAANVLTFGGVLLLVLNYSLFAYYDYDFNTTCNDLGIKRSPIPQWVFLVCAVSQFVSHTMDGTDGKQARRTNASSPLGELFDHGFDSLSVVITVPPMFSLFGMCDEWGDNIWISNVIYLGCMFCFYLPHWEKTVTGVLFLSWSYDASQLCRLIISEMSGTSADKWNWLCSPLLLIIPLAYLRLVDETIMLMLYCSVLAIYHIHYGVRIVQELCDHLNIFCFSIKKRN